MVSSRLPKQRRRRRLRNHVYDHIETIQCVFSVNFDNAYNFDNCTQVPDFDQSRMGRFVRRHPQAGCLSGPL